MSNLILFQLVVVAVVTTELIVATFGLEDKDDYDYEFSILSTRFMFVGPNFLCACSKHKVRTCSCPCTAIWRSLEVVAVAVEVIVVEVIAFDEVERKPNFDLWLSRGDCPVHGYMLKNPHSCKDTKMATPLAFCRGISRPVNWYRY